MVAKLIFPQNTRAIVLVRKCFKRNCAVRLKNSAHRVNSHSGDWFQTEDVKTRSHQASSSFRQQQSPHIYLNDFALKINTNIRNQQRIRDYHTFIVFLDAVAIVVKLGKRDCNFINVVAESVQKQGRTHRSQHIRKPENDLKKKPRNLNEKRK